MRKILLTGKNGQLGWELQRSLMPLGEVVALGRTELDLADPDSIKNAVWAVKPDVIVNAGAYTAVDRAEAEPDLAMAVNGVAPGILAEEARRLGAAVVHYSTDYVFDGAKSSPYTEDDAPNPLSAYGRTKLAGEQAIESAGVPHLILRTSWIYGTRGKNFLLTILRLAQERPMYRTHECRECMDAQEWPQLRVVDDQVGTPNWSRMIAEATGHILTQCYSSTTRAGFAETDSIYHLSASGQTSWYGLALAILEETFVGSGRGAPEVIPIGSVDYPTPAKRPKKSVLANGRVVDGFGVTMPDWRAGLQWCMREVPRVGSFASAAAGAARGQM